MVTCRFEFFYNQVFLTEVCFALQLICEAYQLMKDCLGMSEDEMSAVFREWNKTELDSFLIEISADILAFKDTDGVPLVTKIRDAAGQKGTGKWTAISALDKGMPVTLIGIIVLLASIRQVYCFVCVL